MQERAKSMRQSALKLAMAGGVEYGLQLLMPVILVRTLDVHEFGQYRMLWLLALSALAIAPCFLPQSMFYFLPRATEPRARSILLGNTIAYLLLAGAVAAVVSSGWNPWMPEVARQLFADTAGMSALFIGLWVVGALYDVLPTADGRAPWQARTTMAFAFFRTLALGLAAWLTEDVVWVLLAMLAVIGVKLLVLGYYVSRHAQGQPLRFSWPPFWTQLKYAAPFAVWNALYLLRMQADQWVVVATMSTMAYAMFSIATVLQPVSTLIRQPVFNAVMVNLNQAFAVGDIAQVRQLIARSNAGAAFFLVPVAGGLFMVAPELVTMVYTSKYAPTVPVMQVYIVSMLLSSFAVSHVMPALNNGRFATLNNLVCLPLSVVISLVGAHYFGLPGAALGSLSTLVISEAWFAWIIARQLKVPIADLLGLPMLWPTCAATLGAMACCAAVAGSLHQPAPIALLLKGGVYALAGGALLLIMGGRRRLAQLLGR